MVILGFYAVFGVLTLATAVTAYRLVRRYGREVSVVAAFGVLLFGVLVFPIPIHGGFTFLIEVAIEELKSNRRSLEQVRDEAADRAFQEALEARFEDVLGFEILEHHPGGWARVVDEAGREAWLDQDSGLVWQGPVTWDNAPREPSLEDARDFCKDQPPAGRWSLPTDGELFTLWRSGGQTLMPGDGRSTLGRIVDTDLRMELQTRFAGTTPGYSLRCVARSPAAPRRGYISEDFPLEARNRFQLQKTELFRE